jgi:hypothetical protein
MKTRDFQEDGHVHRVNCVGKGGKRVAGVPQFYVDRLQGEVIVKRSLPSGTLGVRVS